MGRNGVIAVQEKKIFPSGCLQAAVSGSAQAKVLLMNHPHQAGMRFRQPVAQPGADAIGGAVVYQEDFTICPVSGEDRGEAALQVVGSVVHGDDNGQNHGAHHLTVLRVAELLELSGPDTGGYGPDSRSRPVWQTGKWRRWAGGARRRCCTHGPCTAEMRCRRRRLLR